MTLFWMDMTQLDEILKKVNRDVLYSENCHIMERTLG